jgi:prepilin-type N-terminal cleavage/methylation domain-containing protein
MDSYQRYTGFTLIELIITMVIITIVFAVVYVKWPGTSTNVISEASALANDIRYAQNLSLTQAQRFRVAFNSPSANKYQVLNAAGNPIPLPAGSKTTSVVLSNGAYFGGFTSLPNNIIVFDCKGTPYIDTGTPGTTLATTAAIVLTDGSTTKTIYIQTGTGRVTVQ